MKMKAAYISETSATLPTLTRCKHQGEKSIFNIYYYYYYFYNYYHHAFIHYKEGDLLRYVLVDRKAI
jgi:hypothetical protein